MRPLPLAYAWLTLAAVPAAADPCRLGDPAAGEAARAEVRAVSGDLDIQLADGRTLALAGIEAPKALMEDLKIYLSHRLAGEAIAFRPLQGGADRWGRIQALVFAPDAAQDGETLQSEILAAGLAMARAPGRTPCKAAFFAAEAKAREAGLGLWIEPAHAPVEAGESADFSGREGGMVVVEGRVESVATHGYRTYLNFGPRRYRDFSVTVLQPDAKMFDKGGLQLPLLSGHRLRVRGMLDMRFGPQVEIADPEAIEVLDIDGRWPTAAQAKAGAGK